MTADVTARLADGAAALANTAARTQRRAGSGVTPQAVRDCYTAEDGLRLADLDADVAGLAAGAAAGEEALCAARDALAALRGAWQGGPATAALELVERQCEAAEEVVESLADAAAALRSLRELLAQLVDAKVDAALRIDEAHSGRAGEDGDVGAEWVTAMRSATGAVTAAYDDALTRLNRRSPGRGADAPAPAPAAPEVPAAAPSAAVPALPPVTIPGLPFPPDLGAGLGAGLGAVLAGLPGPVETGAVEPGPVGTGPEERPGEDPEEDSDEDGNDRVGPPSEAASPNARREPEPALADPVLEPSPVAGPAPEPPSPVTDPAGPESEPLPGSQTAPPPETTPAAQPLVAEPLAAEADERAPCEIAADELPQVGE